MTALAGDVAVARPWHGGWRDGLRYGGLGLPLAFIALPLYVVLPNHYAATLGVPLAWLGGVLLAARLLDAFVDPLIGRWVDALFARSALHAWRVAAGAGGVLAVAFFGLFFPPVAGVAELLAWCAGLLAVTYLAYSIVGVVHQAWGARLGGGELQRGRIVAWREGLALAGVLLASALPALAGFGMSAGVFALALLAGFGLLRAAPRPSAGTGALPAQRQPGARPLANPAFRRLLAVYLVNGIASAVPATLVLFFIRDRLRAPAFEPLFLASYFAAAGLAMPLWLRAVRRFGLARTWFGAMLLAVAAFAGAGGLGAGDVAAYTAVCLLSGVALGADLVVPAAMLAGVVQQSGGAGRTEGAYFGWWNFATKLNLALAAGIALPTLQVFGYVPGGQDARALGALTIAYCALPCLLKLAAAALLYRYCIRPPEGTP